MVLVVSIKIVLLSFEKLSTKKICFTHKITNHEMNKRNKYIPSISPQTQYSKIGGPIVGTNKSITDTWMLKLGTRPSVRFISENICFKFSVQCIG